MAIPGPRELSPAATTLTVTLAHRPEARRHIKIADTPFFEGEWVDRYFPAPHQDELNLNEESAWQLIADNKLHVGILANKFQVSTAETYSVPEQKTMFGEKVWIIRSLVELVDGTPYPPRATWDASTPNMDQAYTIGKGLLEYLEWVIKRRPTTYIGDAGKINQYVATANRGPVRVDIDQTMWPSDSTTIFNNLLDIKQWATYLPNYSANCTLRSDAAKLAVTIGKLANVSDWR